MSFSFESIVPGAVFVFKNSSEDTIIDLIVYVPRKTSERCIIHRYFFPVDTVNRKDRSGYIKSLTVDSCLLIYDSYSAVQL